MTVAVVGLWHLGTVTAACLAAAGHEVVGFDPDPEVVEKLARGSLPVDEPGLQDLVNAGRASGRLRFTPRLDDAMRHADVVWIAFDTPVDDEDGADVETVAGHVRALLPHIQEGTLVLVSSQLPVGTTRRFEEMFARESKGRAVSFAYSPENLRLGKAIDVFMRPDRVVVGVRSSADRDRIAALLRPVTDRVEWMSVESAEMTKHAINAFLATSIAFTNEVAVLCEHVGADAAEVARGLKSEARIGPKAYVSPGAAFAGGTLARDVVFLSGLAGKLGVPAALLSSVKTSNDRHRQWAARRISERLGTAAGRTVAIWGLTYKPGTDTLRRSSAVELCRWLHDQGADVRAHDPAVKELPHDVASFARLTADPLDALIGASALVVATAWPEYRQVDVNEVKSRMARRLVLDADRFLGETLGGAADIEYLSVGRVAA